MYQQGRIRRVVDVETDEMSPCLAVTLRQIGVKSKLVVPILQGEELWGLLIAHQCSTSRSWEDFEVDLLKHLATQVEIAIQQSSLFGQVQQNNRVLEQQVQERTVQLQQALALEAALKRITDKVRDSLDESQILHTAVEELIQLLQVDYCDTALYNLERGTSTIWYEQGHLPITGQNRVVQMVDFPDIYPQLLQGQYLQFCQGTSDAISSVPQNRAAILTCPMFDDQGVIGDLWLSHGESRSFNELEIRLVQQVANQCAIALRQARLYQAAQAQVEELEKLNRLKDDFLSTVSHELRTPMSSIKMATHMLEIVLKQAGLLDIESSPAVRYFKILQDECQREIGLVNDLLDLARLDAETEPLMPTTIDFQLWLPTMIEPFTERALNQN
ncbi:GAF domain-containing protein [Leptolyngbyaceae cyanobacterium UHCC 1019]